MDDDYRATADTLTTGLTCFRKLRIVAAIFGRVINHIIPAEPNGLSTIRHVLGIVTESHPILVTGGDHRNMSRANIVGFPNLKSQLVRQLNAYLLTCR